MKRFVLATIALAPIAAASFLGLACLLSTHAAAQDLPPDILVDQYLLEAKRALNDTTRVWKYRSQVALSALRKIEGQEIEPPLEFYYLYGTILVVDNTSTSDEVVKGESLLKQYVIRAGRSAEHYASALESLSEAPAKIPGARQRELWSAVKENDAEAIKALIAAGADPNAGNYWTRSLSEYLCQYIMAYNI
ncbi:MAG: hypothetical protein OXR72_04570 [Gemmatimonadota bacterium]|nr:hypothetical protein [Gemmatimonadota bacterium]